ncbi:MAG: lantibiotic dehydratase family protein [Verrucomicrobiota bacterium]|nr:lantibiotic dehydratase family protein [Verrucomicrobiota bacterium]
MADAGYRIAPIFLIRMAGIPFESVERLTTPGTTKAAHEVHRYREETSQAKDEADQFLANSRSFMPKEQMRAYRRIIRAGLPSSTIELPDGPLEKWNKSALRLAGAEEALNDSIEQEIEAARMALFTAAHQYLPAYLVFAGEAVRERVFRPLAMPLGPIPPRNKQARSDERHLLLYLQRIAAKNDSLSAFGPEGWGALDFQNDGITLDPQPGIARRETFLERWTAHGIAAAINADPTTRIEIAPRLAPHLLLGGQEVINTETGESIPLDNETLALLRCCDGHNPAYSLGETMIALTGLAERNLIRWELEVPAIEPHAAAALLADVEAWRDSPLRGRWLEILRPLVALPKTFANTPNPIDRVVIIDDALSRLAKLGAQKTASRFLYAATNPIGEECFRETNFSIGADLIDEVAREAAPWIDLWCDNYAYVASRVAAGLRGLLEKAPLQNGAIALPAFLRHCTERQMPLTGPGMIAFAHNAFREVKAAFAENLQSHAQLPEYELTAADCHFVRRDFDYPPFAEYTYPSADLQLGAASVAAVERGDYQWVLAELHPPVALLHHGFYWSCPAKEVLRAALTAATCGRPSFHFGYFAVDFTATTAVRFFDALPELTYFVAPQRGHPQWKTVPPAEAEVFIDEQNGDVGLRRRGSHEYLGSFARAWTIPLGFHPFSFSLGRHTPRLRCGKVVVQRRSWTVALEELGHGDFTGISRALVVAVERLREAHELPRHVYIRPTEQALRRSGVEGRDKDTKPVYIDLESYLFLEIFHRWLVKAGELEVTEMLPTPDQLLWQEPDGRRTFELRTQIVPR